MLFDIRIQGNKKCNFNNAESEHGRKQVKHPAGNVPAKNERDF